MTSAEKWLVLILRLNAVLMMLAVLAVVMPFRCMDITHQWLGLGQLPGAPIVSYLARSLSAFYALTGFLLLVISLDVRRYGPLVAVLGGCFLAFGVAVLVVDIWVRMPLFWILCEGPYVIAIGCLILWLQWMSKPQDRSD